MLFVETGALGSFGGLLLRFRDLRGAVLRPKIFKKPDVLEAGARRDPSSLLSANPIHR